jgi:hypothetical protein
MAHSQSYIYQEFFIAQQESLPGQHYFILYCNATSTLSPLCVGLWVRLYGSTLGAVKSCSLFKHTLYYISNEHRLKAATEQPPPYSKECTPTLSTSQNYGPYKPEVPPIESLRCKICHGRRSVLYHRKHSSDPIRFPSIGVCSRRRTKCKLGPCIIRLLIDTG